MLNTGMAKNPNRHPPVAAALVAKRKAWSPPIAQRTKIPGRDTAGLPRPARSGRKGRPSSRCRCPHRPGGVSFAAPRGSFYVPALAT